MNAFRSLHRSILILFGVVVISIVTLVHFSVSKIVAEQSRAQQQSISPAITLIGEQLLKPLHVSETLAKAKELKELMKYKEIDEQAVFTMLKRLEREFSMAFFFASDISRMQYNSNGSKLVLDPAKVDWYFRYKDWQQDAIADIGQWEDPHFYIDLKVYDDNGNFLGFFGVSKSLDSFVEIFDQYKSRYGYDFIFVDQDDNIALSSDPDLIVDETTFKTLQSLDWYQSLDVSKLPGGSLNNALVTIAGKDVLVAEVGVDPFGWTMYLLTPLQARQTEISRSFIISVVTLLVIIFVLFLMIYHLLYYFKRDMQKNFQTDPLTRLPNRNKVELRYSEMLDEKRHVGLVLIDIDHFKSVNDNYGHNAGDDVLRQISKFLQSHLRDGDVVGRWGGEEFVLLLPDTTPEQAFEVAQKLCTGLAGMTASTGSVNLQVTASFGVSHTAVDKPLTDVLAYADDALYQAKRDGRNMVKMQLSKAA
ncbi:sensor domain-containing diguanylate cyclase [Aliiglaciecola sp. LCG003]|uniref:sensor domain-containing diguanylate cyclase n=1 Tax=Aliiglaciecola sp. LCG003 TaxID=3053655 RepID=UPI002572B23D|nr:sensor domain-containing diguanylate cyclase [Aliiglaciecola sp. LCG003]WJG09222.1 sensor domain-containing diguanylate cyclase [Aliiglaciecola sp. LCG003]